MHPPLKLTDLRKRLGGRLALAGATLTVAAGEAVAIVGPNGCGKTTMLRCAAGLLRPTSGTVRVFGADPLTDPAVRVRVAYLGHELGLYDELSARENLVFFARLFGLEDGPRRAMAALEEVGLGERAGDRAGSFSRGMKERLALARLKLHDPDLLLLDEPTTGLDDRSVGLFIENVTAWQAAGKSLVLTTHDRSFLDRAGVRTFRLEAAA